MPFRSTKTYGHELGLSCSFRQHRANSHCNLLHGYALSFKFTFEADELNEQGWVQDFGGLKALKVMLVAMFDHTLVVAKDDPHKSTFNALHLKKLADVRVVDGVGCEAFARLAFDMAKDVITETKTTSGQRVRVVSCECSEHGANGAIYIEE